MSHRAGNWLKWPAGFGASVPGGFRAALSSQIVVIWHLDPGLSASIRAVNEVKGIDPAHDRRV
jgi:hypothetical protein